MPSDKPDEEGKKEQQPDAIEQTNTCRTYPD